MKNLFSILMVSFLILGTMLGAGILGLPTSAGLAGFIPASLAQIIAMLAMLFSAVVIIDEVVATRQAGFNYPSLYEVYIGKNGKWIAITANLIMLYGLLIAYISGSCSIISNMLGLSPAYQKIALVAVFLFLASLSISGTKMISRYNSVFVLLMLAIFIVIIAMLVKHMDFSRLTSNNDFLFLPSVFPIVVSAFCFHTIIPSMCSSFKWDRRKMITASIISVFIAFILNTLWIGAGIGIIPLTKGDSLDYAYRHGLPATIPLDEIINSGFFSAASVFFALLAITTSFIGVAISLKDFLRDIMENTLSSSNKSLNIVLTFLPPLLIAFIYPDIFLIAMNIVGGIGNVILFGILPSIIFLKKAGTRKRLFIGILVLIIFSAFLVFEIGHETGLLRIDPKCEYYQVDYSK